MRKLIRKKVTGAFLSKEGDWTHDAKEAADFLGKWPNLNRFGQDAQHDEIEFYYWFGESVPSPYDFAIPIFTRTKVSSQIGSGGSQRSENLALTETSKRTAGAPPTGYATVCFPINFARGKSGL